jgi:DNA processing protein
MPLEIESIPAASTSSWLRFMLAVPAHRQFHLLLDHGSPDAALAEAARSADPRALESAERWLASPGRRLVGIGDPEYPALWKQIATPPCAFFAEGRVELLGQPCLAIVGSRNATPRGRDDAHEFAHAISDAGVVVASGLALGIDGAAHRGALQGATSTVAVIGTGPDRVYPSPHADLAAEIAQRGCIVSEFPLGTPPLVRNFPRRNRLISGLARGVLVVEAAQRSGSLGTARAALEQNREVFALPGSIHSPLSKGCHWLIKEGAKLVDCVDDVLQEIGVREPPAASPRQGESGDSVLDAMGTDAVTPEHIAQRTGLDAATLAARLSWLEIEGRVLPLPGGWFQRAEKRVIE